MKHYSWKLRALSFVMCTVMGLSAIGTGSVSAAQMAKSSQIHVYAPTGDNPDTPDNESPDQTSDKYTLLAEGTEIPVIKFDQKGHNFDVARFSSDIRTPEFTITVSEDINSVNVYPQRYYPQENLKVSADKRTLTFSMSAAASLNYAIVMINGDATNQSGQPYLAIINDPLETGAPDADAANVLNFKNFAEQYLQEHPNAEVQSPEEAGTVSVTLSKGKENEATYTYSYEAGEIVPASDVNVRYPDQREMSADDVSYAFQAALDKIYSDASLDTLYFPNGTYTYAGLDIRNRKGKPITIYLEEGALLKNRIQSCAEAMEPAIGIWDSSDITISGRGMFDGNGVENYWKQNGSKSGDRNDAYMSCHQAGVMVVRSSNITFRDTYMRNAKQWNWEAHSGKHIRLNNIKGLTPYDMSWGDGTDMASSQDLVIDGAFTLGNDDCFASGHYNPSRWFAPEKEDLYKKEFGLSSFKPQDNNTADEKFQKFSNAAAGAIKYNGDCDAWDTEDSCDITVKNTLQWSCEAGNGIRLGHEAHGYQLRNYTFENFNALGFAGGGHGITVQNHTDIYPRYAALKFINCSFDTSRSGNNFVINGGDGKTQTAVGAANKLNGDTDGYTGETITKTPIETVELKNCWFSNESATCSVSNTQNLTIENLYIGGKKIVSSSDYNLNLTNVENVTKDYADNAAPFFTSPEADSFSVADGETLEFHVTASDSDEGDTVTLRAEGVPKGAEFDPADGSFSWNIPEEAVGTTYEITFIAADQYAETRKTVQIKVSSSQVELLTITTAEDATLQTWKTDKNLNKNLDYVRTRRAGDLASSLEKYGYIGEKGIGSDTNATDDQKMSLLKFDVSSLSDKRDLIASAELSLTYIGRRDKADGMDTLRAAVVSDSDWSETAVTWNSRPEIAVEENGYRESAQFLASGQKNIMMAQDEKYAVNQEIDGRKITIDITDFIKNITEDQQYLTLAVNETKGFELAFVSKDGAGKMSNADASMAPSILLSMKAAPVISGPESMQLAAGYEAASTEVFQIKGYQPVTTVKVSGDDKITWNDNKKCLDIAAGLAEGSYPVKLKVSNDAGEAEFTFTLTVTEGTAPAPDDKKPVTGIQIQAQTVSLEEGKTYQITASVLPADTTESKAVKFTSLDERIASVSETGLVTAVKAGTAQIRVSSAAREDIFALVTVTVTEKAAPAAPADTKNLASAVNDLKKKDLSGYTKASAEAFQKALAEAEKVLSNPNAAQTQIDAALKALTDAEKALTKAQTEVPSKPLPPKGYKFKSGSLQYQVTKSDASKGTVSVIKLVKSSKKIVIPPTVKKNGYTFKVTAVGKNVFQKNKKLQEIVIGANITSIGTKSFYQCKKLGKITFMSKKAPQIKDKAFSGIKKTCKITVPKKMTKKNLAQLKKRMKTAGAGKKAVYKKSK